MTKRNEKMDAEIKGLVNLRDSYAHRIERTVEEILFKVMYADKLDFTCYNLVNEVNILHGMYSTGIMLTEEIIKRLDPTFYDDATK